MMSMAISRCDQKFILKKGFHINICCENLDYLNWLREVLFFFGGGVVDTAVNVPITCKGRNRTL